MMHCSFFKRACSCFLLVCAVFMTAYPVLAENDYAEEVPYVTYNYDHYDNIRYTPAAYVPAGEENGKGWADGGLKNPQDLFITKDGFFYIADTGNNRIVVLKDFAYVKEITSFQNQGAEDSFLRPEGIYVSDDGVVYVADTGHNRVVAINEANEVVRLIENPKAETLEEDFVFSPKKVAVDYADRVFVIAQNVYQGMMSFDQDGVFQGFVGTVNVTISAYEIFWRNFSTKAQREQQKLFIPTEFTQMDIDAGGFIYATNIDAKGEKSVRRLNSRGQDVIRSNGKPLSGDRIVSQKGDYSGASRMVDVVERGDGIYSVLDSKRGRIFTYNSEGSLMYIFGGIGTQKGTFSVPVAIECWGEDLYVLDSGNHSILRFTQTQYGQLINKAVRYRYNGNEALSVECWNEVLKLDGNLELAFDGIGKAHLAAGENADAMNAFDNARNQSYYSIAFKRYRNEILKDYLPVAVVVVLVAGAVGVFVKILRKKGGSRR